jgi:hypothetical protein
MLWGLPVIHAFILAGVFGVGVFLFKGLFGFLGACLWLTLGAALWGILSLIQALDPCVLAVRRIKWQARFPDAINSFRPGRRTVQLRRDPPWQG